MNDMSNRPVLPPEVDLTHVVGEIGGYHSLMVSDPDHAPDITSDDYAREQASGRVGKSVAHAIEEHLRRRPLQYGFQAQDDGTKRLSKKSKSNSSCYNVRETLSPGSKHR